MLAYAGEADDHKTPFRGEEMEVSDRALDGESGVGSSPGSVTFYLSEPKGEFQLCEPVSSGPSCCHNTSHHLLTAYCMPGTSHLHQTALLLFSY